MHAIKRTGYQTFKKWLILFQCNLLKDVKKSFSFNLCDFTIYFSKYHEILFK